MSFFYKQETTEEEITEKEKIRNQLKAIYTEKDEEKYIESIVECYEYLQKKVQTHISLCYNDRKNISQLCKKIDKVYSVNEIGNLIKSFTCPITLRAIKIPVYCSTDDKIYELGALLRYFAFDKMVSVSSTISSPINRQPISFRSIGIYKTLYDTYKLACQGKKNKQKINKKGYEQILSSDLDIEQKKSLKYKKKQYISDDDLKKAMHLKIDKLVKKIKCSLSMGWFCVGGLLSVFTCCITTIPLNLYYCVHHLRKKEELKFLNRMKRYIDKESQQRIQGITVLNKHYQELTICCGKVYQYFTKETKEIVSSLQLEDFGLEKKINQQFYQRKLL
ncbi:MAG: hypothetical protein PVG30_05855 [Gammaproteobacteria bacterium]|jgi:hypothetical protein